MSDTHSTRISLYSCLSFIFSFYLCHSTWYKWALCLFFFLSFSFESQVSISDSVGNCCCISNNRETTAVSRCFQSFLARNPESMILLIFWYLFSSHTFFYSNLSKLVSLFFLFFVTMSYSFLNTNPFLFLSNFNGHVNFRSLQDMVAMYQITARLNLTWHWVQKKMTVIHF